jgi:hypothetical protein
LSDFNEQLMRAIAQSVWGRAHCSERAIDLAETFDAEMGLLIRAHERSKRDRIERQFALGLVQTAEGLPIAYEDFKGSGLSSIA